MGNICQCLRYYICCCSQPTDKSQKDKRSGNKKTKTPDSPPIEYETDVLEDDVEEEEVISEERIRIEALKGFKGGETSYASVRGLRPKQLEEKEMIIVEKYTTKIDCKFLNIIGSGSYSQVYKVFSLKHKKYFALKVIVRAESNDKKASDYIKNHLPNEIQILRLIPKHQNIVKVKSLKKHWNRVWILMEFANKGTITDLIKTNGAINETMSKPFIRQILDGVNELHIRNIAHRDLKLENILLSAKYVPKISDFSYSIKVDPSNPLSSQFCGTLPYFPPEILQRTPYNPLRSDIWSLGVCFYIMLNDGLPFKIEKDDSVMLQKQLNKDWKFRQKVEPNLSRGLKDIIISMLEPMTELRPNTQNLKSNPWFQQN